MIKWSTRNLGKVEGVFPLLQCKVKFVLHDFHRGVVRQLEVVHTCHHRGQEVIRVLGRLDRLAHNRQLRTQSLETCTYGWVGCHDKQISLTSRGTSFGKYTLDICKRKLFTAGREY